MKTRLSNKLSPRAKKAAVLNSHQEMVDGHLLLAPNVDIKAIRDRLEDLSVSVGHYNKDTCQLSVSVPANQLNAVAHIDGVVYVEAATNYSV